MESSRFTFTLVAICTMFFLLLYPAGSIFESNQQFTQQAESFLQGKTDMPIAQDTIDLDDKHYWHQAPFPSLVIIPGLILFGPGFDERIAQVLALALLISILYKLAQVKGVNHNDSIWLVCLFLFGSVVINLMVHPSSWYFAQIVAMTLLSALLLEFETKKRVFVLGLLSACLIATRPSSSLIVGLIIASFVYSAMRQKEFRSSSLKKLSIFLLFILLSVVSLLWFNWIRFGNPIFNTYQASTAVEILKPAQSIGAFSLQHIPSSLYFYFLASVVPVQKNLTLIFPYITYSPLGLSFFIVCPFFIQAFKTLKDKRWLIYSYWAVILITLLFLLTFFGMAGYVTYGPRYVADFLPILYLLVIYTIRKTGLSQKQRVIIFASILFNMYMIYTPALIRW